MINLTNGKIQETNACNLLPR